MEQFSTQCYMFSVCNEPQSQCNSVNVNTEHL